MPCQPRLSQPRQSASQECPQSNPPCQRLASRGSRQARLATGWLAGPPVELAVPGLHGTARTPPPSPYVHYGG
eukprot:56502-Chlamydomonas_euryale.AAC.1